jgi:hypothetical protein
MVEEARWKFIKDISSNLLFTVSTKFSLSQEPKTAFIKGFSPPATLQLQHHPPPQRTLHIPMGGGENFPKTIAEHRRSPVEKLNMNDISLPLLELRSVVDKFEAEPSAAVDKADKFHDNSDEHLVEAKMGALSHDSEKKDLDPILKDAGEAPEFCPIDNLNPSPGNVEVGVDTHSKENMGPAVGTGSWAAFTSGFNGFYARGPLSVPTIYSQPQPYSFDASSYSPQVPICTPPLPTYSSHAQSYSPQIPGSSPKVPDFSPHAPTYSLRIPVFSPEAPVYSPQVPTYSPQAGTRAEDMATQMGVTHAANTSESEHGGCYHSRSKKSLYVYDISLLLVI